MHHCYIGLPQRRIPLCHNGGTQCFFGAICGIGPITTLTRKYSSDSSDYVYQFTHNGRSYLLAHEDEIA